MKPDLHVLQARAVSLRQNIDKIQRLSSLPDERFWSSELHIDSVKLHLIQAITDLLEFLRQVGAYLGDTL